MRARPRYIITAEGRRVEGQRVIGGVLVITDRESGTRDLVTEDDDAQLEHAFTRWLYQQEKGTVVYIEDLAYDRFDNAYWNLISRCFKLLYGQANGGYYKIKK
jgi:hypothetical protein